MTTESDALTVTEGKLTVGSPTITGTARVGNTLTAAPGTGTAGAAVPGSWTAGTKLSHQWQANGRNISGARARTRRLA